MGVKSRMTVVENGKSFPKLYMTAKQLSEYEGKSPDTYRSIIHEIEYQIRIGRYPRSAIGNGKPMDVNYYVYRDYMANREMLMNKNAKKLVPAFNPSEIAMICPLVKEVIVCDKG